MYSIFNVFYLVYSDVFFVFNSVSIRPIYIFNTITAVFVIFITKTADLPYEVCRQDYKASDIHLLMQIYISLKILIY